LTFEMLSSSLIYFQVLTAGDNQLSTIRSQLISKTELGLLCSTRRPNLSAERADPSMGARSNMGLASSCSSAP
jgi:hypothetical protein